jgi:broad specificity phosphatase PhoE
MTVAEPTLYLCRHGDTAWSGERRLAGRTDLPLVEIGEHNARQLGQRLVGVSFASVLVSPLTRARRTAELAGFGAVAQIDERLVEMDFGQYDGRSIAEIHRERPGWTYLREGCPGGEDAADLGRRADALLAELAAKRGNVALFAHSVILRVVAARFLGLPPQAAGKLMLSPGALGILGFDEVDDSRSIATWNDRCHLVRPGGFA